MRGQSARLSRSGAPVAMRPGLYARKRGLSSCSVLRQTFSMKAEMDCKLQSNSS